MRTRNPRLWLRFGPVELFGPAVAASIFWLGLGAIAGRLAVAGIIWIGALCLWRVGDDIAKGAR